MTEDPFRVLDSLAERATRRGDEHEKRRRRTLRLVGVTELAAYLGVSRERASQLGRGQDVPKGFPPPIDRLAAGPIWDRRKIEDWIRRKERA